MKSVPLMVPNSLTKTVAAVTDGVELGSNVGAPESGTSAVGVDVVGKGLDGAAVDGAAVDGDVMLTAGFVEGDADIIGEVSGASVVGRAEGSDTG